MTDDDQDKLTEVLGRIDADIQLDAFGGDLDNWSADLGEHIRLWLGDQTIDYAGYEWDEPGATDAQRTQNIYSASPGLSVFVLTSRYAMRVVASKKVGTRYRPKINAAYVVRRDAISSLVVKAPALGTPDPDDRHALIIDVEYEGIRGTVHIPSVFDRESMHGADPKLVFALRDDYLAAHSSIKTLDF